MVSGRDTGSHQHNGLRFQVIATLPSPAKAMSFPVLSAATSLQAFLKEDHAGRAILMTRVIRSAILDGMEP